ncbi:hypothetical protein O181_018839 [Austropuccinia psidii MF-1]|uniref:Uncharacterized protein n=1 Tax=Austropuccinia psidii MF-1 TaxID=1389203 RepID=A0A9Q3GU56_9BASI|nr:hypothetical protein [Austropuccinia psidii MF-1]
MNDLASEPPSHYIYQLNMIMLMHHLLHIFPIYHPCTSEPPQLTILTLLHCPLMLPISNLYADAMIGFQPEGCSFPQLTILALTQQHLHTSTVCHPYTSTPPQLTILKPPHCPLMFSIYHPYTHAIVGLCMIPDHFPSLPSLYAWKYFVTHHFHLNN